jgi:hypothetical protein
MGVKSKRLSRRTFLRGTGVALGLPLLEAMLPARAAAAPTAAAAPVRAAYLYVSMLDCMGVPTHRFGDSTEPVRNLLG